MKKFNAIKLAITALFCLILVFSSVSCKKDGRAIEIEKMPIRTVYYIGEAPDLEGMKLSVKAESGRETVDATVDMLDKDSKLIFTKKGDATLTVVYNGLSVSFKVFVDDDLEAHRVYALSYLSEWADNKIVRDEVTLSCIERAKQLILESKTHEEIVAHLNNARDYTHLYSEDIRYKGLLRIAKLDAEGMFLNFDFSPYTLDQREEIESRMYDALIEINLSTDIDDVQLRAYSLIVEAEKLKSDEKNARVKAFEEEFNGIYEKKAAFFPKSEYDELIRRLIDAEKSVRAAESEQEADAIIEEFFEKAENTFPTYPDVIYKKIVSLKKGELVYGVDNVSLDEIAADIFTFVYNLDGDFFVDTNAFEGIKDLPALAENDSFRMLRSCLALTEYETTLKKYDLISEALALYEDYTLLESASKESSSVVSAIDSIGKVTLDSSARIEAARSAFKVWSEKYSIAENSANIFMISNYEKLKTAEKEMKDLPEKAKKAADEVRTVIKALLGKTVIYSDEDAGVGKDIEKAKKAYQNWIDTYGSPIDSYLNDGTNYKIKLDSYVNEYDQIKAKAENIIKKIAELRAKLGALTYENYDATVKETDALYKALEALYTDFANTNGKVVDKVSAFLSLEEEIIVSKVSAYAKHYCKEIQKKSDEYSAKVHTAYEFSSHRSNLKTITSDAKEAINDVFDENKSLEQNLKNLLTEYNDGIKALDSFYNSYLFDYEVYSANEKLSELSNTYSNPVYLEKRDEIINKAKNDISRLSKTMTIEKYSASVAEILKKAEEDLKAAIK